MAEVITILGVASSIVQLVDSVAKLKGICGAFKDASTDLADLVIEISISAKQLNKSRERFEGASLLDCDLVSECLEYLEQALLAVNTVSAEMQKALAWHKKLGAIKFVWKSDQIQKLRSKLERAQRLLDRTERLVDRAERELATSEQSRQVQAIRFSSELLAQTLHQTQNAPRTNSAEHRVFTVDVPPLTPQFALESLKKTPLVGLHRVCKGREYKIALPLWLWSKVVNVVVEQQISSISCTLRYNNVFRRDSDLDRAVLTGDINTVKTIFSARAATPFDVREDGASLLGLAAFRCDSSICRFLISQGAEVDRVDPQGDTFLDSFALALYFGPKGRTLDDYNRNMQDLFDLCIVMSPRIDQDLQESTTLSPPFAYHDLLFRTLVRIGGLNNTLQLTREERAHIIVNSQSPLMIEKLLGSDLSLSEAFTYATKTGPVHRELLYPIIMTPAAERHHWSQIVQELMTFDRGLGLDVYKNFNRN